MGPAAGGLEVRWEVLRCETTVCSVCIWLEFFRQFLGQCQKAPKEVQRSWMTPAERLNILNNNLFLSPRRLGLTCPRKWAFFLPGALRLR